MQEIVTHGSRGQLGNPRQPALERVPAHAIDHPRELEAVLTRLSA